MPLFLLHGHVFQAGFLGYLGDRLGRALEKLVDLAAVLQRLGNSIKRSVVVSDRLCGQLQAAPLKFQGLIEIAGLSGCLGEVFLGRHELFPQLGEGRVGLLQELDKRGIPAAGLPRQLNVRQAVVVLFKLKNCCFSILIS